MSVRTERGIATNDRRSRFGDELLEPARRLAGRAGLAEPAGPWIGPFRLESRDVSQRVLLGREPARRDFLPGARGRAPRPQFGAAGVRGHGGRGVGLSRGEY